MKRLLLVNDDGMGASGLKALIEVLQGDSTFDLFVVAPDSQRSGVGHSINLHNPIFIKENGNQCYTISGTPADAVKIGLYLMNNQVDMVISGINQGPNMGVDVYYSGTVGAAREAAISGITGIAFSLASFKKDPDFGSGARFSLRFIKYVLEQKELVGKLLNINIPFLSFDKIKGVRGTVLGNRIYNERMELQTSPKGQKYFWINDDITFNPLDGSDLDAVEAGFVSVTPLKLDTTDYDLVNEFSKFKL